MIRALKKLLSVVAFSVLLLPITGLEEAFAGGRGFCGDGVVDPNEQCDGMEFNSRDCVSEGFEGGTIACTSDCMFDLSMCEGTAPVCGNGVKEGSESCDGDDLMGFTCVSLRFQPGTLGCTPSCTFDTSQCGPEGPFCGDGVADDNEQCDGEDLAGRDCSTFGFSGGALACSATCEADTSDCNNNGVISLVGGDMIQMQTTSILAAGAQYTAAWMIPVLVSAIGIGIVVARKI